MVNPLKLASCLMLASICSLDLLAADKDPLVEVMEELRNSESQQTQLKYSLFKSDYLNADNPRERMIAALALGHSELQKKNYRLALQYISSAKLLVTRGDLFEPIITLDQAEIFYNMGSYSACVNTLQSLIYTKISDTSRAKAFSLVMRSYFRLGNYRELSKFAQTYFFYVPKSKRDPELLQLAAIADSKMGNFVSHITVLEELAEHYPIVKQSRWAFFKLLKYNREQRPLPPSYRYYFAEPLLKKLSANQTLDARLKPFLVQQINGFIRERSNKVRALSLNEKVDLYLKFNLPQEAKALLRQLESLAATEAKREKSKSLLSIARIHSALSNYTQAAEYFARYLRDFSNQPDSFKVNAALASEQSKSGDYRASAGIYQNLALKMNSKVLRWDHFWNTYMAGDYESALQLSLSRNYVYSKDASEPLGLTYWQGKIYEKLGRNAEAQAAYRSILNADAAGFYSNLVLSRFPDLGKELIAVKIPEVNSDAQGFARPRYASNVLPPHIRSTTRQPTSDLRAIEDLINAGLKREAKSKLGQLPIKQYSQTKDLEFMAQLATKLSDYRSSKKISFDQLGGFNSYPTNLKSLVEHISKFRPDWEQLYPLAYAPILEKFLEKYELNKFLVLSIMRAESSYNEEAHSPVGARGLMQIMPKTALRIAQLINDPSFRLSKLYEPVSNLGYAVYYLHMLENYYGGNIMVTAAAYNAGPIATNNWLARCQKCDSDEFVESIPYQETRRYVKKVLANFGQYSRIYNDTKVKSGLPELPRDLPDDTNLF